MNSRTSDARRKAIATRAANKAATATAAAGAANPSSTDGQLSRPLRRDTHRWELAEAATTRITAHLDLAAISALRDIMATAGVDKGQAIGLALIAFRDGAT